MTADTTVNDADDAICETPDAQPELPNRAYTTVTLIWEERVHYDIVSLVGKELGIYRCRVLSSLRNPLDPATLDIIEEAEDEGRISIEQVMQVTLIDIILLGVFREDRATRVGVAIEVSRFIDDSDIAKARERADILSAAVQTPTIAAVVGGFIQPQQQRLAERLGVRTIITPEDLMPSWVNYSAESNHNCLFHALSG